MVTGLVGKLLVCAVAGELSVSKLAAVKAVVVSKRGAMSFMGSFQVEEVVFKVKGQGLLRSLPRICPRRFDIPQLSAT